MRQEEAELKLRKFHSKMFAKLTHKNAKESLNDNELDVFNVFERFSKETKSSAPVKLSDALVAHLKMGVSGGAQLTLSL
ncbi:MAG TPA: hypothetical protein PLL00_13050 [Bacteroidia bacterium]|jgi:hypothetical protein|nr:hypothetical protein [Bacteroidia bacterium]